MLQAMRVITILAVLGFVGVAVYTGYRLSGGPPVGAPSLSEAAPAGDRRVQTTPARARPSARVDPRKLSGQGGMETEERIETPVLMRAPEGDAPGVPSPEENLARFERALDRVDDEVGRDREIDPRRRAALYQDLSESFQSLTTNLNGRDPNHMAYLEQARREMRERMRALDATGVRVGDALPERARAGKP